MCVESSRREALWGPDTEIGAKEKGSHSQSSRCRSGRQTMELPLLLIKWIVFSGWLIVTVSSFSVSTGVQASKKDFETAANRSTVRVIDPGGGFFRDTNPDELSVVSFNVLAPSYHCMGDCAAIKEDRATRLPASMKWAQSLNADILLLQEVDEGTMDLQSYDNFWSLLRPQQDVDRVGLAVAWKANKFCLVHSESFPRGQIVMLESLTNKSRIIVANLHLFAKPSAILGRVKVMSNTIKRIQNILDPTYEAPSCALDSMVLIGGDLNCNDPSVATNLLQNGCIRTRRRIKDRNYSVKLTKDSRSRLTTWLFPFENIYKDHRELANITVSLQGRGPGCMDHLFFMSGADVKRKVRENKRRKQSSMLSLSQSRRQYRRKRVRPCRIATQDPAMITAVPSLKVQHILATMNFDKRRSQAILDGLPNLSMGFPSDHLPIGVMLGPDNLKRQQLGTEESVIDLAPRHSSSLSQKAKARRDAQSNSVYIRSRHNALVRAVCEWLLEEGATQMERDKPLRKWKWTQHANGLKKKSRAPDVCCVIAKNLLVIEVTVGPERLRTEKTKKYGDLAPQLRRSTSVQTEGLAVAEVVILVVEPDGKIPARTRSELQRLAELVGKPTSSLEEEIRSVIADFSSM